jgi:hypothetical protein
MPNPNFAGPGGGKLEAFDLKHFRAAGLVKTNHLLSHLRSLPLANWRHKKGRISGLFTTVGAPLGGERRPIRDHDTGRHDDDGKPTPSDEGLHHEVLLKEIFH